MFAVRNKILNQKSLLTQTVFIDVYLWEVLFIYLSKPQFSGKSHRKTFLTSKYLSYIWL